MNKPRALRIVNELKGKEVGNWTIIEYINNGKSAVVAKASHNGETAALKIFDPDLVEYFGRDEQLSRIEREKTLIGKSHPNLVNILDGGACSKTDYFYVVMAYLPEKNLSEVIKKVPRNQIFPIISQIASAAKFLEDMGLAHRDIKPENVAISNDFKKPTLLDLGVLRPLGLSEIEGYDYQKAFLATLQYSPPELLYRIEEDNIEGWRAVTFYQLGAILYDLIMRKPIFYDYRKPYPRLVDAVRDIKPVIIADDIDSNLILLAQSCLLKVPRDRLTLVNWDDFLIQRTTKQPLQKVKERIIKRRAIAKSELKKTDESLEESSFYERYLKFQNIVDEIKNIIRTICINTNDLIPPIETDSFVKNKTSDASIFVCFHHSSRHSFYKIILLSVLVSFLGDQDEIVNLKFIALESGDCNSEIDLEKYPAENLFFGPYEPTAIKEKLNILLLALIDNVLESESKTNAVASKISLEPIQLMLNIEEEFHK